MNINGLGQTTRVEPANYSSEEIDVLMASFLNQDPQQDAQQFAIEPKPSPLKGKFILHLVILLLQYSFLV